MLTLLFLCSGVLYTQFGDIDNTLGTGGTFRIRTATDSFFTVRQSTGNVSLFRNLELGAITNSTPTRGMITKNGIRFIHNRGTTISQENTFIGLEAGSLTFGAAGSLRNASVGYRSLYSLIDGLSNSAFGTEALRSNTYGDYNSVFGYQSLYSNTTGSNNSAFGPSSLYTNTSGNDNSAFGREALYSNTTGNSNSAFGYQSLYSNTDYWNSAFGYQSLSSNTTGSSNSAFGRNSLSSNTTGNSNSAFGRNSLSSNTTGYGNTGIGHYALHSSTGNNNTVLGDSAGINITTGSNNIAIGYNAQVPSGSSSNQIRLGNTSTTYAGIEVAWTVTSDRRYKDNITPIALGLEFISKLNPVSYHRKNDESKKTEYGLIAQEVEQVLKELGIENHAMLTVTDEGMYELRYNDLIAPMIKAIQELKVQSDQLENEKDIDIAKLKGENEIQEPRITQLELQLNEVLKVVNKLKNKQDDVKNVNLGEK